jgi:hypothetical protein
VAVSFKIRRCKECRLVKPLDCFYKHKGNKGGYMPVCKVCKYAKEKGRRSRDPEKQSHNERKRLYGITKEEFLGLLDKQDHKCAVCRTSISDKGKAHVDHSHDTGIIRGLLCIRCNRGIGLLRDSPEILKNALLYLTNPDITI